MLDAIRLALSLTWRDGRLDQLKVLAANTAGLEEGSLSAAWDESLHTLSARGRPDAVSDVEALIPLLRDTERASATAQVFEAIDK